MKAVRLQAYGDVDQLRYEDAPNPVPGAGEALVKIAVSGLNPVDLIVRKGLFAQIAPLQFPAILGSSCGVDDRRGRGGRDRIRGR